jgi:exosortase
MPTNLQTEAHLDVRPQAPVSTQTVPLSSLGWFPLLLPLGYLWFRLLNNLRLEWTTNPQYSYGLIVPVLALGLLLRRLRAARQLSSQESVVSSLWSIVSLFSLFAFLYLPTRLVEAATPEWRPIQWMLGIEAVGLTLCAVYVIGGRRWVKQLAVPVSFILVAVPWPTIFEIPLIQALSRFNAAMVVEVLGILGVPSIQHGNVIEVSSGVVGIDDACSGIRSFQSSLMVSIFFGEFFRLALIRRLLLVPIGFGLAMAFNLCRASFLTYLAATHGVQAIATYHDSAGLTILLACMACMWAIALLLRNKPLSTSPPSLESAPAPEPNGPALRSFSEGGSIVRSLSSCLFVWLILAETSVWTWYHLREAGITPVAQWTVVLPTGNPTFAELPMAPKTYNLLRFDEGKQGAWRESDGTSWQAFYFNWFPGRVSSYLAKRHTPDICLPATGGALRSGPNLMLLTIHGVELPMRHYVFDYGTGPIQVYQCHWEAGVRPGDYTENESSRFNLVRGIWAGRGVHGQKVLELIITGQPDQDQAKQALIRQLEHLIKVESQAAHALRHFPAALRSDESMVAMGFSPWCPVSEKSRRVATVQYQRHRFSPR